MLRSSFRHKKSVFEGRKGVREETEHSDTSTSTFYHVLLHLRTHACTWRVRGTSEKNEQHDRHVHAAYTYLGTSYVHTYARVYMHKYTIDRDILYRLSRDE